MKKVYLLLFALFLGISSAVAQNTQYVYYQQEVKFFGIDFSHVKMIGTFGFEESDRIVDSYFARWNEILFEERVKYNVEQFFHKRRAMYHIHTFDKINRAVDHDQLVVSHDYRLDQVKIFESVNQYDLPVNSGLGMVLYAESFNKLERKAVIHVVFFDIATRDIITIQEMEGEPGGLGLRNYWANAIHDIFERWEVEAFRQVVLDKIYLTNEKQRKSLLNKLRGTEDLDRLVEIDEKTDKRLLEAGISKWPVDYYEPMKPPAQAVIQPRTRPVVKTVPKPQPQASAPPVISDVDVNIPNRGEKFPYRFALIIGNEDYQTFQPTLSSESNVDYANRDAEIFKNYCNQMLGVPDENVVFLQNARVVEMNRALQKISKAIELTDGKAEVFVYYAGHGFPDQNSRDPYIMPVDVSASDLTYGFKLSDVYKKLTEHECKRVTVFIDACFSGGARNQGLLAARAVKIVPKEDYLNGNIVVFSACSGSETAQPLHTEGHGLFTYYLLKKMQETSGDVSYADLYEYLKENIGLKAVFVNEKEQTPDVNASPGLGDSWKDWNLY
ncbi:caspase family protein [bacterium SCSIO 12741]|nr:caspase family protein [bacterium SCSIO 12741]